MRVFTFTYILTKVISFSFSNTLFIRTFGCRSFNWIHFFHRFHSSYSNRWQPSARGGCVWLTLILWMRANDRYRVPRHYWDWLTWKLTTTSTRRTSVGYHGIDARTQQSVPRYYHSAYGSAGESESRNKRYRKWIRWLLVSKRRNKSTEEPTNFRVCHFSGGKFLAGGWWLLKNCSVPHQTTFCSLPSGDLCMALEIY